MANYKYPQLYNFNPSQSVWLYALRVAFIYCTKVRINCQFFVYFYKMRQTDEYIFRQPEKQQSILLHLITIFEREIPELELLFKWGIPYFYFRKKPFCYLAPNSKIGFVDAGFARGFQLKRNQDFLVGEKRNTVKSLRYYSLEEIDNTILEDVIREARSLYP
jgi:hypothetical protein